MYVFQDEVLCNAPSELTITMITAFVNQGDVLDGKTVINVAQEENNTVLITYEDQSFERMQWSTIVTVTRVISAPCVLATAITINKGDRITGDFAEVIDIKPAPEHEECIVLICRDTFGAEYEALTHALDYEEVYRTGTPRLPAPQPVS